MLSAVDLTPIPADSDYTLITVYHPVRLACLNYRGLGPGQYRFVGHLTSYQRYPHDVLLVQANRVKFEFITVEKSSSRDHEPAQPRILAQDQAVTYGPETVFTETTVEPSSMEQLVTVIGNTDQAQTVDDDTASDQQAQLSDSGQPQVATRTRGRKKSVRA